MHIEELPNQLDEKLKPGDMEIESNNHSTSEDARATAYPEIATETLGTSNSSNNAAETSAPVVMGPKMSPMMAEMRSKTTDDILAELNKTPLFMTELEENDDLEAFKALAYEGSPAEVALQFKEHGNECFTYRAWRDAREYYDKAVAVLQLEDRKRRKIETKPGMPVPQLPENYKPPTSDPEEIKNELSVLETCLINRAACHLELQNYRSCTLDCALVLRLNSSNVKAFYRSGRALLALSKIAEADDVCARGLELDPNNAALKQLATQIIARNEVLTERQRKEDARQARIRQEKLMLTAALQARNIQTSSTDSPPNMDGASICLSPDPLDPASSLSFPTMLLYPAHLESDFIRAFGENDTLDDHLSYILPLPWDNSSEYTLPGVACYAETTSGGLVKIGRKLTLLKVLSSPNLQVVDQIVRIFVLPKGRAAGWVADWKEKKAGKK